MLAHPIIEFWVELPARAIATQLPLSQLHQSAPTTQLDVQLLHPVRESLLNLRSRAAKPGDRLMPLDSHAQQQTLALRV